MLMNEWDKSMLKIIRASEKGKRLGLGFSSISNPMSGENAMLKVHAMLMVNAD
jgi:hypothetical protein